MTGNLLGLLPWLRGGGRPESFDSCTMACRNWLSLFRCIKQWVTQLPGGPIYVLSDIGCGVRRDMCQVPHKLEFDLVCPMCLLKSSRMCQVPRKFECNLLCPVCVLKNDKPSCKFVSKSIDSGCRLGVAGSTVFSLTNSESLDCSSV